MRVNVAGQTRGRPRYIGGRALTRIAAWLDVNWRQLLQHAEDDARVRRRCDEDDDHHLSPTSRAHKMHGKFPRRFTRISFVRSPRAHPRRPGMAWARRMDGGPNPGEIENPGAPLDRFSPSE
jgi:hypothetical protein